MSDLPQGLPELPDITDKQLDNLMYFCANAVEDPEGNIHLPKSREKMESLKASALRNETAGVSTVEEALHRIANSDIIKWDADTQEEYEREFMPWAKQIAKEALIHPPEAVKAAPAANPVEGYEIEHEGQKTFVRTDSPIIEAAPADDAGEDIKDEFRGDDLELVENIKAIIHISDSGIASHPLGGHARTLLASSAIRLSALIAADRRGK